MQAELCAVAIRKIWKVRNYLSEQLRLKSFDTSFESFDIYIGPINSTYGEVFWTGLPETKLPPEIVSRFAGKGMAVVGFESDQVRRGAGPNGEDVSVPINVA